MPLRKKVGYNFFICEYFKRAQDSDNNKSAIELMSEFSKKWRELSESEKAPYCEMANKYNAEISVTPTSGSASKSNKKSEQFDNLFLKDFILTRVRDLYHTSDDTYECPICMDEIVSDKLEMTKCGHYFCSDCSSIMTKCAVCRTK
jgi:hypothetical protein